MMQRYIMFIKIKDDTLTLEPDVKHQKRMKEKNKTEKYFSPFLWVSPCMLKFNAWNVENKVHPQQMMKAGDKIVVGRLPGFLSIESIHNERAVLKKFTKDGAFTGETVELVNGCYSVAYTEQEALEHGAVYRMPVQNKKYV